MRAEAIEIQQAENPKYLHFTNKKGEDGAEIVPLNESINHIRKNNSSKSRKTFETSRGI